MAFSSKGFSRQADRKTNELMHGLVRVAQDGKHPVLIDTSPCAQRLNRYQNRYPNLRFYDISDFLTDCVVPRVHLQKRPGSMAIHVPCSLQASAQEFPDQPRQRCAENVCVPKSAPCCGSVGDRCFTNPELIASALVSLKSEFSSPIARWATPPAAPATSEFPFTAASATNRSRTW